MPAAPSRYLGRDVGPGSLDNLRQVSDMVDIPMGDNNPVDIGQPYPACPDGLVQGRELTGKAGADEGLQQLGFAARISTFIY